MVRTSSTGFALLIVGLATVSLCHANEGKSLMGMISQWQYPGSTMSGATMSDGETVGANGERTRPSIKCKTVLSTPDAMSKVIEYYETKLKPAATAESSSSQPKAAIDSGRSVSSHDDSENRPVAIHIIVVNTDNESTTLVISRGETESMTHIAWTHYERL